MRTFSSARPLTFALIVALAAMSAVAALAQDWKGRGRIHGKVTDMDHEPIAGATVHLLFRGQEGVGPEPIKTKKNGTWAYMGLSSAPYTVRIAAEGYHGSEGEMRVNEYASSPAKAMEVKLRKLEAVPADSGEGDRLMALVEEGNHLLTAGRFAEARDRFEQVQAKLDDEKQKTQLDRAIAATYLEEGQTAEARKRFEALLATAEDPATQADLLRSVARSHYMEGNVDQSVASLESSLATAPGDAQSLRLIVDILVGAGRETEAEPYIAQLPEGEKIDPNALLNLGITAYNGGDLDTALEKFQKVVDAYPDNASAHYYLGLVLMGKMENEQAISHLRKSLELEPEHSGAGEAQQFLDYLTSL